MGFKGRCGETHCNVNSPNETTRLNWMRGKA